MLTTPADSGGRRTSLQTAAHAHKLDEALPEAYQAWYADQKGHHVLPTTGAIRLSRRVFPAEEHAERDKEIPEHLGVAREHVSHEHIAELALARVGEAADADTSQGREEAIAAGLRDAAHGDDEAEQQDQERYVGQYLPGEYESGLPAGEQPEEQEGDEERQAEEAGEAVGRVVVRDVADG